MGDVWAIAPPLLSMVSLDSIYASGSAPVEYCNTVPVDIYDSPECKALATQAIAHRHLRVDAAQLPELTESLGALPIVLVEDCYPGWLRIEDVKALHVAEAPYQAIAIDRAAIAPCLEQVITFAKAAMAIPNEYLWGGTIGPNLDCSGLVQRAYGSQGIWLPRDAYQQEAFVESLPVELETAFDLDTVLKPGDLIFFGPPEKATHVAIYLEGGQYIHSSGKEQGRNQIGIDSLSDLQHPVSRRYAEQFRGAGRVMRSFCP